jgi:CRISPR-associated protein Csd2
MAESIQNRYEFVFLFDVELGNPNGDPDAGNMPRLDYETNEGLVTDVCLKRKVRNFVELAKESQPGYAIYVREKAVLNDEHEKAYKALGVELDPKKRDKEDKDGKADRERSLTRWMCDNYFDIRTFGAVMTTGVNCGQVRGPVQFSFAKSVEQIQPQEVAITRMAVTNEKDAEKERTMGRKFVVPYALYKMEGYISAHLADRTGFSEGDLALLWQSLINMFDHDRSASRGKMSARKLIVFKHASKLGEAPAQTLFDLVKVGPAPGRDGRPSRSFSDHVITVNHNGPDGVEIIEKL